MLYIVLNKAGQRWFKILYLCDQLEYTLVQKQINCSEENSSFSKINIATLWNIS